MSKSQGQGTALSADLLYERALAIIDEKGFEALSMRRLASDLGVEAASLYHHVPNKQALLDGALALMRSEMQVSPESSGEWIEDMEEVFVEYRRVLAAHPNMVLLAGRRLDNGTENGIAYLMDAGFTLDDAVELMQSLRRARHSYEGLARRHLPANAAPAAGIVREPPRSIRSRSLRSALRGAGAIGSSVRRRSLPVASPLCDAQG